MGRLRAPQGPCGKATMATRLGTLGFLLTLALAACGGGGGGTSDSGQDHGQAFDAADPGQVLDTSTTTDPVKPLDNEVSLDQGTKPDPGVQIDKGQVPDEGPKDTSIGCPSVVTGDTCAAKVACAVLCADENYQAACLGSDSEARTKALELLDCLGGLTCGSVVEEGFFTDCAEGQCEAQIEACFAGTGNCNDIRKCRMECDPEDLACPLRCLGEGTVEEQGFFAEYVDCIMGVDCVENGEVMPNGWPTEKCEIHAQHFCPKQTEACIRPR